MTEKWQKGSASLSNLIEFFQTLVFYLKSNQLPQLGFWSYILLAILVILEGPMVTMLGAAAASAGLMRPVYVFAAASIGSLSADTFWYSVGYMGKAEWFFHFGRRLGIREGLIRHLEQSMIKHAIQVLFLAKLTVSFMIPSLVAAGLLRIPWKRWFPTMVAAETLWIGSLVLIGYYTTEAIKRVQQGIEYVVLAAPVLFVIILVLAGRRLVKKWEEEDTETIPDEHQ